MRVTTARTLHLNPSGKKWWLLWDQAKGDILQMPELSFMKRSPLLSMHNPFGKVKRHLFPNPSSFPSFFPNPEDELKNHSPITVETTESLVIFLTVWFARSETYTLLNR